MSRRSSQSLVLILAACTRLAASDPADWNRFRGESGTGVATNQTIPTELNPETDALWSIELAEGTSSPIIVGERLFVTSHRDGLRTLHCLNAVTGKSLWEASVPKQHDEIATPPAGPSTPTPACDGERVYASFPDAGTFAWTVEGQPVWNRPAERSTTMHGLSASLVCHDGRVFQIADQLSDSWIAALDAKSGEVLWKRERLPGVTGGYSTPVIYEPAGAAPLLITTGPFEAVAYDPATGERVWWLLGRTNAPVSSPLIAGDTLYFCESLGERLPMSLVGGLDRNKDNRLDQQECEGNEAIRRLLVRIDSQWGNGDQVVEAAEWDKAFGEFEGKGGLTAVRPVGSGDVSQSAVIWNFTKGMPYIPGVLVDGNVVFAVDDGGVVTTINATTGEQIRKGRLQQGNSQYYASPVAAGGHVVLVDTKGVVNVITSAGDWSPVSHFDLGTPCYATPAIAGNRLYVRTTKSLYCFGAQETPAR
jgi:outer membrane protein assembly factor BamB